ncbi:MAG: DNA repair protein RecN [Dermabacter sp.]|nr:DNA repair protein RecN [Dermabacter sp.]
MLKSLSIHRIGVINEAILDFGPGFTALTGETGAGKTMVVTGLGLLMGRRLDSRRAGISSTVEGRVQAADGTALARTLDELGADAEDGEYLVVRRVTKDGRSRAHVGGVPVPVSTLADLVGSEITIHGQSDQQRLRDPRLQREALDAVLSEDQARVLADHAAAFAERETLAAEVARLVEQLRDREQRQAELTHVLERLEAAHTYPGEDDEVRAEIEQLTRAGEEVDAYDEALMALVGDESASMLAYADRALSAMTSISTLASAQPAADGASLAARVQALRDEVSDVARELSLRRDDSTASPGRLAEANERLHELSVLVREVGPQLDGARSVTELLEASQHGIAILEELDGGAERLASAKERIAQLDASLDGTAAQITEARRHAATLLAERIEAELEALEMPGAAVRIRVSEAPLKAHGADAVAFELRPHPGADFLPLATGASGGELSRVMLALEVAMAALADQRHGGQHPVFIFDEIDAGIGGRAARAVGERLARLAESAQVIVVTHLPQVASCAQTHLRIVKDTEDSGQTTSRVMPLDGEERVRELARMLSGDEESDSALTHARELLERSALGAA